MTDPALLLNMSVVALRKAGINATPMDRPEDCEVHPFDGSIYLTLTNNSGANHTFKLLGESDPVLDPNRNEFGHVIRMWETDDHDGLTFD